MPHLQIISLFLLAAIVWFWSNSLRAREAAVLAVREACEAEGLQLLDETVSIASLRLERNGHSGLALRRVYGFEYSDTGDNRRQGSVHLLGARVVMLNIGLRLASVDGRLL